MTAKNPLPEKYVAEWHPSLNHPLTPEDVSRGSNKKVWWLGECGHEWDAQINTRVSLNRGCPVCSGQRIVPGVNDLATINPILVQEWNYARNVSVSPTEVSVKSNRTVWWVDTLGHEWEAKISNRSNGTGCPFCTGNKVWQGFNDLESQNPPLAAQWHPTKNPNAETSTINVNSSRKAWWMCPQGHEWESRIDHRNKGVGCPTCSGKIIITGKTDIATTHPLIASIWHPDKNLPLTPEMVSAGSSKKIWWKCQKGHEFQTAVCDRTRGYDCASCAAGITVSQPEKSLAEFIESLGFPVITSARGVIKNRELDIYVPSKNIAIEYNGLYWHSEAAGKDRHYHQKKWSDCKNLGIQLIQIWEDEYHNKPALIQNMLAHKLGVSTIQRVYARKTVVSTLTTNAARSFLDAYHIQGFSSGSYYLGLQDKVSKEIIAVLVLRKEANNTLNIIRYATSKTVVGGFTKLLKYARNVYAPKRFITFSDNCVSDGALYSSNGFISDKQLAPDYRYVVNKERLHKFGYRLKRFREDPALIWRDDATERELADLNGLKRIWDAGKIRWVLTL